MAAGSLMTARGKRLNMGDLKLRQRKAMPKGDMKDTVQRQQRPVKQANVRGYIPSMEGVNPNQHVKPAAKLAKSVKSAAKKKEEYEPSIADFTGVIIDNTDGKIEPPGEANALAVSYTHLRAHETPEHL